MERERDWCGDGGGTGVDAVSAAGASKRCVTLPEKRSDKTPPQSHDFPRDTALWQPSARGAGSITQRAATIEQYSVWAQHKGGSRGLSLMRGHATGS